jgi:phytoene dehydrogenase-like protein
MDEKTADVIVVGAGLAGLAAAATAARAGRRTLVLDGRSPGGRARTDERNGFLFNQGAHALYRGGKAEEVLADLGVTGLAGGKPSLHQWGVTGDLVSPLPFTPTGVVRSKLVGAAGKAQLGRFFAGLLRLEPASLADRSAESWLSGLGYRDDATDILRMLSRVASYAGDLDAISADAVAGQLKMASLKGVRYLDHGWRTIVDGLLASVTAAGATVETGDPVVAVEPDGDAVAVRVGHGGSFTAAAVVLATGGPAATASLLREPPRWGLVGPPSTAACLDLGLRADPDKRVLFGVGRPLYLSTHTGAADLAPAGRSVVHVMRYGARDAETDRAELWEHAHVAGIADEDVVEQRFLARMVTNHAVPVPGSGLAGRPSIHGAGVPGIFVAGDWVGPEGLLADAALASGQAAGVAAAARPRVAVPA